MHVLRLNGLPIFDQLRVEEWLLRNDARNWFVFNIGPKIPQVVLGYSGKVKELVNTGATVRDDITMIRRYTGGGTVVVDESTIFTSLLMNNTDAQTRPYPRDIMQWSLRIFGPVFENLVDIKPDSPPLFSLRENDYVIGELKIGGNAQSIVKERWCHHTSFLWDFNDKNMAYLQIPKRQPEYREGRDHSEFLTKMKDHCSSIDHFQALVLKSIQKEYDVVHVPETTVLNELPQEWENGLRTVVVPHEP
jgi:lipoate-protein ligase A